MKVFHLLNNFDFGGAESLLFDFGESAGLKGLEWSFLLIRRSKNKASVSRVSHLKKAGVNVFSAANMAFALWFLFREGRKVKVDVLHAHNLKALICACIFKVFFRETKVVFTQHTSYLKRPFFHRAIKIFVDAYIAICNPARLSMLKNGISENRTHLLINGVSVKEKKEFFRALPSRYNLLVVGRMVSEKNHNLLIDAVSRVAIDNPDIDFRIWFFGDGPLRPDIERKISMENLEDRFVLLGNVDNAKEFFHNFDLFLMTSNIEGMPISALESLASGVPVLSTDAGGLSEIVESGVTGLIVPVGDVQSYSKSLAYILTGNELQEYKENLRHSGQDFEIDGVLKKHLVLYQSLGSRCS